MSSSQRPSRPRAGTPKPRRTVSVLRFESTRVEPLNDEEYRITGKLTIRGVTDEIVLHAEVEGRDVDPCGQRLGKTFDQGLGSAQADAPTTRPSICGWQRMEG
jgi:YceI-like domain